MQLEKRALGVLVSSFCCSTYRVADPFSSMVTFYSSPIGGLVIHPIANCEHPLLCSLGPCIVSQERAIWVLSAKSCQCMQWCLRLAADYGMDSRIWHSLDGPSFCHSSKLYLCNSFHGCFVLNSKKGESVNTLPLLRIRNKTPMEGVTETKFGAVMKGWTIQRLPYPGIHPIISFQMLTLLHTLARLC